VAVGGVCWEGDGKRLRPFTAIALLLLFGLVSAATASYTTDGRLEDWGTWNNGASGLEFAAASGVEFATTWSLTDNIITEGETGYGYFGPDNYKNVYSGGEKFDVEGLYLDLVTDTDGFLTHINWAMVTSFNELGDPDYAHPKGYRFSPVLSLDLNGDGMHEWGLVLDSGDGWTGSAYDTTGYNAAYSRYSSDNITTTAELWRIQSEAAWVPVAESFGLSGPFKAVDTDPVMFTTVDDSLAKLVLTGDAASSVRRRTQWYDGSGYVDYTEYHGGSDPNQMISLPWYESNNWTWEGSLNVTGLPGLVIPEKTTISIHYTMYCGNDWVTPTWETKGNIVTEPEPALSALLLLAILPVGAARRRRRRP
jgi:hypothetical protein